MKKLLLLFSLLLWVSSSWAITVQVGTGTSTNSNLPIYSCYGYTYSQQIYTQAQINTSGQITTIRFYYVSGTTTQSLNWTIFLGHTTKTTFASTTDWVPYADLTQVFSGTVTYPAAGNWMEITLTTPFSYDNSRNLVVAVDENTPGYYCSINWRSFTSGTNTGIYYRNDTSNPNPASPPTANSRTNTLAQIQFEIQSGACSGTPDPGNTLCSSNPACASIDFTLSLQNSTQGEGVTYQWQKSPNGTDSWTNFGTSTASVITNQTSVTYYRCQVTCSGNTGTSTPVLVELNPFYNCYCNSIPGNIADEEIFSVTINGNTNAYDCFTTAPGPGSILQRYSNFRTLGPIADIYKSANVPFSVNQDECDGATYYTNALGIWIDFNQDGDFLDAGEEVFKEDALTKGPRTITGSIFTPADALVGVTGMRIIDCETYYGATLVPCLTYSYGETEDYLVNIVQPLANLAGFVYDYNGNPVEGATIELVGGISTGSGAGGDYLLTPLPPGDVQFKCSKAGYNDELVTLTMPVNGTVNHNFTLLKPEMAVTPPSIFVILGANESANFNVEIVNDGTGLLNWEARENFEKDVTYSIDLFDAYGDGWNGGKLDVLVNGVVVLDDITIIDGEGPETFNFDVSTGDEITTVYTPGSWSYENGFVIYDEKGASIYTSTYPPANILPGELSVSGEVDWLTLTEYSGQIDPFGGNKLLTLTLDAAATPPMMAPGVTYEIDVLFLSPNGHNIPVHVTMIVTDGGLQGPENLTPFIVDEGQGKFMLKWQYFTLRDMTFDHFEIYSNGVLVGTTQVSNFPLQFTEDGNYCYKVYAVYEGGVYTEPSNEICITYPLAPGVPVANWALVLGGLLMASFVFFRFYRRS